MSSWSIDPRAHQHTVRRTVTKLVRNVFPGTDAEFVGDQGEAAPRSRRFGFRIVVAGGEALSDTIWLDPSFYSRCNRKWLERAARMAQFKFPDDQPNRPQQPTCRRRRAAERPNR